MTKIIRPGTDNQRAGTYKEVGPRGGSVPKADAKARTRLGEKVNPWATPQKRGVAFFPITTHKR